MRVLGRVTAIVVACAIIGGAVFFGLTAVLNKNIAVCEAQNNNTETWVKFLSFAEGRTLENPALTPLQKQQTVAFYKAANAQLAPLQKC